MRERRSPYREVMLYVFFGGLTTLVNYITYFSVTRLFHGNYVIATVIAWIVAVLFAFLTNRRYVFESKATKLTTIGGEFAKFVGGRVFSLFLEMGVMIVGMDVLHMEAYDWAVKTIAQIGVVVFNYFLSKWFVFKNS